MKKLGLFRLDGDLPSLRANKCQNNMISNWLSRNLKRLLVTSGRHLMKMMTKFLNVSWLEVSSKRQMVHISCLRIIETTLAPIRWNDKTIETVIPFYKKKNFIYKKSKAVLKLAKLEKIGSNGFTSLMANLCHKKGACALIEHFLEGIVQFRHWNINIFSSDFFTKALMELFLLGNVPLWY